MEDPIEYVHKHGTCIVTQREVPTDVATYSEALRSAMRESPDVILLGEMRDQDTIGTAVTAAEMAQLLFSTLHTTGAAGTVDRIIDAFPLRSSAKSAFSCPWCCRQSCRSSLCPPSTAARRRPSRS